jgi:hypothetical protein
LDLPRELRDYVYSFVFSVQGAIFILLPNPYGMISVRKARIVRHRNQGPSEPKHLGRVITLSMMRVCRQVHAECSPVLYGKNVFRIGPHNDIETSIAYRQLVRHVIFIAETDHRIYKSNLDEVNYGWKRRFWPSVINGGTYTLERYPNLETFTITLRSPYYGQAWRPAFFAVENKTREQRIALAAQWLHPKCPVENERLRACLRLELDPSPSMLSKDPYTGSRIVLDDDEEMGWDYSEFAEAFQLMLSFA